MLSKDYQTYFVSLSSLLIQFTYRGLFRYLDCAASDVRLIVNGELGRFCKNLCLGTVLAHEPG
jgi:hypothetical protein